MKNEYIKGTEALILSLLKEGVDTIFGYPGGTIMPLYDELYNYKEKINHILVRHEQGAVHAAEGFARSSGKTGVCIATAGPGATNLVTGIADALIDSTPLVCITAQVSADKLGTNFFQEADTISITIPVTKWSYQITFADEIEEIISKAFYIARTGRPGPVLISFTRNAQVGFTNYTGKQNSPHNIMCFRKENLTSSTVKLAAELINKAKRPLIIVGQGVIISGAEEETLKMAERGNIPIASTLMGLSAIPTSHHLFAGNVGMHGNFAPNMMTQKSDLLIAIGMRFSDRVTGDISRYAPKAKIIHIDIDKAEFNKTVKSYLQIHGDAKEVVAEILPLICYSARDDWFGFKEECIKDEKRSVIDKAINTNNRRTISMAKAVATIAQESRGNAVIVTDVGQHQMFCARYSIFNTSRSMITSGGLGTMGFGLPAAIGAKFGAMEREIIAVLGDGGFQMTIQELGTIMQSGIDIKIVVLNNSFLGMVRQWQELFFNGRYSSTEMDNPDFLKIAESYRITSKRVENPSQLQMAVREMLLHKGSYLLEIVVEKEENVYPMIPSGASLDEIIYK
jgi:acetolactate synthase-1/2/3 large subunit